MMTISVVKRNGSSEPLDLNKFHRVVECACDGITGVSASEIELRSRIQFYDGIRTSDIQETLIRAAAELITEDTPNYQYVAGRLVNYHIRKQVYGGADIPSLAEQVTRGVELGFYDPDILSWYDAKDLAAVDGFIDHDRDYAIAYAGMEQFRGKYLQKDRVTGLLHETPQFVFALVAMVLFRRYSGNKRLELIREVYDACSTFELSLPTPIMSGLRSPIKQFSSCVLIDSGDSLDSMNATASAIVKYVSQRAGIGVNVGRIRALGSRIRNGDASHTGIIPFLKYFQAAVKSCSQGGVRGGAATFSFPCWHLEFEDMIVLKNNRGTEDNRVRGVDYCVQFNRTMYERLLSGGDITLFSPHDVPDLYEAFFGDADAFEPLYAMYESNPNIRKKRIPAIELFSSFMQERKDTGRIYLQNVDHVNEHGAFRTDVAPIYMTNLCNEIALPSKPLESFDDPDGQIALCTLIAQNWGRIRREDFKRLGRLCALILDELLDYQDYPVEAARTATMLRRPLGVGIVNLAYWMAKNGYSYQDPSPEALRHIHEWAESWSYWLISASVDLAEERGACPGSDDTKYSLGILPIDTYKRDVDELVEPVYHENWDGLRERLRKHGIRNSTLMALMPAETSAQVSNSTNGVEPPRALVSVKQSKDGVLKQVVPEVRKLKNRYDLLWDQRSPEGYLKIMAVLQKFVDQSISVNTSYNPKHYPDERIPMSELLRHVLLVYKWGIKSLYYFNTHDGAGEIEVKGKNDGECDACKI
jgi:ribonucleoside-diphosphate reductase alpha chain